jgi:hypothetical protein
MKQQYIIQDWAGNLIKFKNRPYIFETFDDAEEILSEELDSHYETDRGEYYIIEIEAF